MDLEKDENGERSPSLVWTQIDKNGEIKIGPIGGSIGSRVFNGYKDNSSLYKYYFPELYGIHVGYTFIDADGNFATDFNGDDEISALGEDSEVFDDVTSFSEGLAGVRVYVDDEPRWTFMTTDFIVATEETYDSVKPFINNIAVVQKLNTSIRHAGNWGAVDKNFNVVIPYKFSSISIFNRKGFAYATINSTKYIREGWINKKGEYIWDTKRKE